MRGEEARSDDAQGRHQDHGRRHADPDLGEGERARLRGHGQVGRRDEAEAAGPGVAVDPGDDRHGALHDAGEDVGHAVGRRRAPLGEVGARAEHGARPREDDGAHLGVASSRHATPASNSSSSRDDSALRLAGESSVRVRMPPSCCTPTNASVTGRSVGGCPAEGGKGPVVSFAGDRDRRAPAVPQDAPGPLRAGDRAPRRRVGGGPHVPRPRPLSQAGRRRACSASSTTRPTGAWARTTPTP